MTTATNLTGRAGRWSAAHPWRSIGLWVGLLVVALAAGTAVGTVQLTDAQSGSGEAARAEQAISRGFQVHATERMLVSRTCRPASRRSRPRWETSSIG